MNDTTTGTITIPLTDHRPVTIIPADWPVIASASGDDYDGCDPARHQQASAQGQIDEYELTVRQHADGRAIVYGTYTRGFFSGHNRLTHAGYIMRPNGLFSIERAIGLTGNDLGVPEQTVADCIASLPAEQI